MLTLAGMILARRGADNPVARQWALAGEQYRTGTYALTIHRGDDPREPVLASVDTITAEPTDDGATVTLALSAEIIGAAQGQARPVIDHLVYRLSHDGTEIYAGLLWVFPRSGQIEAPRKLGEG
jgi:hypothetical protein